MDMAAEPFRIDKPFWEKLILISILKAHPFHGQVSESQWNPVYSWPNYQKTWGDNGTFQVN